MTDMEYAGAVAMCAHKALIYEAMTAPKPGLVDRFDSGAHKDMDIFTFVDSAEALIPYFYKCAAAGIACSAPYAELFDEIRGYGLKAEKDMFAATNGVNTHKGAVLSLGLLCAAAGILGIGADADTVCRTAGRIGATLLDDFRRIDPNKATFGETQYLKSGRTGIRGEAVSGFRTVRELALPVLRECLEQGMSLNDSALFTLMRMITETEDTTLLKRCGERDVEKYRHEAAEVTAGREMTAKLEELNRKWSEEGISAGGCADLLGVTLFLLFFTEL